MTNHAWHNFDDELPPPCTAIEVVRYVHTSVEWAPICHRVVSTVDSLIPREPLYVERFADMPPRTPGERSTWWRLTDEWVSNGQAELVWIPSVVTS
jgi:hypothetical protein